jgi:hypothetical protein
MKAMWRRPVSKPGPGWQPGNIQTHYSHLMTCTSRNKKPRRYEDRGIDVTVMKRESLILVVLHKDRV